LLQSKRFLCADEGKRGQIENNDISKFLPRKVRLVLPREYVRQGDQMLFGDKNRPVASKNPKKLKPS
jgi:hypothetical protein